MNLRPVTAADDLSLSIFLDSETGDSHLFQTVKSLRDADMIALERLVVEEGKILGYLCCAKMVEPADWWVLVSVVVSTSRGHKGLGREMISHSMNVARRENAPAVLVLGDPAYYAQVGFSQSAARNLDMPFGKAFTSLYPIDAGTELSSHTLVYPHALAPLGEPAGT